MKGKRTLGAAWLVLFAFMFVFAVTGCSSVSTISDDSSWESRLTAATTFGEVAGVYWDAPEGSEVGKAVLEKMLSLATTFEEVARVYRYAPEGSEVRKAVLEKMLSLATTFEEGARVYRYAPEGSEVRKAVLEKMLSLATTLEEVRGCTGTHRKEAR